MNKRLLNIAICLTIMGAILTGCAGNKPTNAGNSQEGSTESVVSENTTNSNMTEDQPSLENKDQSEAQVPEKLMRVEILDKDFKEIGQWSEGLCPVLDPTSGMWGYVDKTGNYAIPPQYYEAAPFSEDLAAVKGATGVYTFIDKTGKAVITADITDLAARYHGELKGFKDGLAVVRIGTGEGNYYKLIDKTGTVIKECDKKTDYELQMRRFYKREGIVTNTDDQNIIFDEQYNIIATPEGYHNGSADGSRILFNYSTKYLLLDNNNRRGAGPGLRVFGADGSKVFDQNVLEGSSLENGFQMGITDDYIVVFRTINQVKTAAVFNYDGSTIIDYKYKEIYPITKDVFIAKNNADIYAVIDATSKELVPFSYKIKSINGIVSGDFYSSAMKLQGLSYLRADSGLEKIGEYLDLKTMKIESDLLIRDTRNAFPYRYECDAGIFYVDDGVFDENLEPLDCNYISNPNRDWSLFFKEGIIPVRREGKSEFTFGIITR